MKSILSAAALLALPGTTLAQTLHNAGATLNISAGTALHVAGDLTNTTAAAISNNGQLHLSGNAVNNGSLSQGASALLLLNGTAPQMLAGSQPVVATDVYVNNTSGINLATPLRVNGSLGLLNGHIQAPNSAIPVIFSAGANLAAASDASHVVGFARREGGGAFTFPVGDGSRLQAVLVNITANSAGLTARYVPGDAGAAPFGNGGASAAPLVAYNALEYWDLTPVGTASGEVLLGYDGYRNLGISSTADLRVAHRTGGQWQNEGGTASGSTANGSILSAPVSTWGPFTLGSIALSSPLPLVLLDFSATPEGPANELRWRSARPGTGSPVTIERSADGLRFVLLGTAAGGETACSFTDGQPLAPLSYYRLRFEDGSGSVRFSNTAVVHRTTAASGQVTVFPVPAGHSISVACHRTALHGKEACILDAQGLVVLRFALQASQEIQVQHWPAGTYALRLPDGETLVVVKR